MKKRIKEYICLSFGLSFCIIALLVIFQKIGYRKYYTYLDPTPWSEIVEKLPYIFLIWFIVFLGLFMGMLFFRDKPMYCLQCKTVIPKSGEKSKHCPKCGQAAEPLEGVFERHPDLLGK